MQVLRYLRSAGFCFLLAWGGTLTAQPLPERGKLLFRDTFQAGLGHWVVEAEPRPGTTIKTHEKQLVLDVAGGATVWLKQKWAGDLLIEYKRRVVMAGGPNDRLSDLNQFWMATDPRNPHLFTRRGPFADYDSLVLYYVGFGGNENTTTRFRKYLGSGERVIHHSLSEPRYLLKPNHWYTITITVVGDTTAFYVDGKEFFSYQDPEPLREGYFGFRIFDSHQQVSGVRVYAIEK